MCGCRWGVLEWCEMWNELWLYHYNKCSAIHHYGANKHHQLIFFIIDQHIIAPNTAVALSYLCRQQRLHPPLAAAHPYHLLAPRTPATGCMRRRFLRPLLSLKDRSHQLHPDHPWPRFNYQRRHLSVCLRRPYRGQVPYLRASIGWISIKK